MTSIVANIQMLREQIQRAEKEYHRLNGSVQLLAVSKQRTPQEITQAFHAGIDCFGENYLQEAQKKIQQLSHLPIEWHFIGALQSNKTKAIAQQFSWVHTVTDMKIADRLNRARPPSLPKLNVCLQVNLDDEKTKHGIALHAILPLAQYIVTLPNIQLRGLMAIPRPEHDFNKQLTSFLRLSTAFNDLNAKLNHLLDTLSMGMSHDFPAAIAAGSTLIRIGTAIFGPRDAN